MSGITDIKNAFSKAAPGIDLRAVRMKYLNNKTLLEFDICGPNGEKYTVTEELPITAGMTPLLDAAMKVAKALGATVEVQDNKPGLVIPSENTNPLAEKAAEGIAKLVSVSEPVSASVEIEHQGEKYELAHDGSPTTLFF